MNLAEEIRQFTYRKYIQPAILAGKKEIVIRAGDVHKDMQLQSRMPSVCQALEVAAFHNDYNLELTKCVAPPKGKGANVYFHFRMTSDSSIQSKISEIQTVPLLKSLKSLKKTPSSYESKISDFLLNYKNYHNTFYKAAVFTGPSLHFHRRAIEMKHDSDTERSLEYIYSTLVAWGMHRMGPNGAKMKSFNDFSSSISKIKHHINEAGSFDLYNMSPANWSVIEAIFHNIDIMQSGTKIVGNSKVMAHLLPHIIPPIDRAYTLKYLDETIAGDEWLLTKRIIEKFFIPVVQDTEFNSFASDTLSHQEEYAWNTSLLKIVDNVIIGAIKTK